MIKISYDKLNDLLEISALFHARGNPMKGDEYYDRARQELEMLHVKITKNIIDKTYG